MPPQLSLVRSAAIKVMHLKCKVIPIAVIALLFRKLTGTGQLTADVYTGYLKIVSPKKEVPIAEPPQTFQDLKCFINYKLLQPPISFGLWKICPCFFHYL